MCEKESENKRERERESRYVIEKACTCACVREKIRETARQREIWEREKACMGVTESE